jgi:hypothetical protein
MWEPLEELAVLLDDGRLHKFSIHVPEGFPHLDYQGARKKPDAMVQDICGALREKFGSRIGACESGLRDKCVSAPLSTPTVEDNLPVRRAFYEKSCCNNPLEPRFTKRFSLMVTKFVRSSLPLSRR